MCQALACSKICTVEIARRALAVTLPYAVPSIESLMFQFPVCRNYSGSDVNPNQLYHRNKRRSCLYSHDDLHRWLVDYHWCLDLVRVWS